jgi:hypothetical protein
VEGGNRDWGLGYGLAVCLRHPLPTSYSLIPISYFLIPITYFLVLLPLSVFWKPFDPAAVPGMMASDVDTLFSLPSGAQLKLSLPELTRPST